MAMEDALVLTESLVQYDSLEKALDAYVTRRRPRVRWVHQESTTVAESFRRPSATRNAGLRQHGAAIFQRRFTPLVAAP